MAEIREIKIRSVDVPSVPDYLMQPPQSIPSSVPVTVQIGFPVVDLPGCVEAHETKNAKNNQIKNDDRRGVLTFCDGQIPSFNPINFNDEVELPTPKPPIPLTRHQKSQECQRFLKMLYQKRRRKRCLVLVLMHLE